MWDKSRVGGSILAGGQSRRMGASKALMRIGGVRMIDRVYGYLRGEVARVCVNGNKSDWQGANWEIIEDIISEKGGPLIGIWTSLQWAESQNFEWLFTLPVDTPFLPDSTVTVIMNATDKAEAKMGCAITRGQHHPVIACWHVSLISEMASCIKEGTRKIDAFVANTPRVMVAFDDKYGQDVMMNVNTPGDLDKAQRIFEQNYYAG